MKKFLKIFFSVVFSLVASRLGMRLGHYLSVKNKLISGEEDAIFLGEENEWLAQYARRKTRKSKGLLRLWHRHIPLDIPVEQARYINLGIGFLIIPMLFLMGKHSNLNRGRPHNPC